MDRNDQTHHRAPAASPSGAEEAPAGDSKLAQRIWGRYGSSPGVIPTAVTLGLAGRVTRLSNEGLLLLSDVQRRQALTDASFARSWFSLPHAQPPAFAGTLSPSTHPTPPGPETLHKFGSASPAFPAASLAGLRRTASALSAEGAPLPQSAAGGVQRLTEAHSASPSAASVGERRAAIPRRHASDPVGRSVQHKVASPGLARPEGRMTAGIRQSAGPPISPDASAARLQPAAKVGQPAVEAQPAMPTATSASNLATVVRQGYLEGPAGRAIQRKVATPESARLVGRTTAGGEGAPLPHPTASVAQHAAEAQALIPTASGTNDPGVAILQRPLDDATGQAIQRKVSSPQVTPSDKGAASFATRLEMPLMRAADEAESAMLIQTHSANGHRFNMPLVTSAPTGRPASIQTQPETTSGPSAPAPTAPSTMELPTVTAAETGSEVDVMRLADQVYEILVRRLATERERRGL